MAKSLSGPEVLSLVDQSIKKEFESNRRILSFEEYVSILGESPERHLRGSARYVADMMDSFGTEPVPHPDGQPGAPVRFKLFDLPLEGKTPKVVGQELVQNQIYRSLKTFTRTGLNNKLLLLHGPNGSAKTSLVHSLMGGLERYSRDTEGSLYTFNWIFPVERYTKGGIGLNTYSTPREAAGGPQSFAKIPDEEMAARIPCDMRDHPLLLVPQEHRKSFLEKLVGAEKTDELWPKLPTYLTRGDVCHRCKLIFDALLIAANGDLRKVMCHVQVERFYFAKRYRKGLVTIEPQMHVDAQFQQLTYNRSVSALPASLQSLNLFALTGDLVDGNRGIIEYSDLLKRPVDAYKYLLTACETGSVNVGTSIAYLDAVMLGSTNEVQLDAFKEFPDFTSFKARIELIRVPYLLSVSGESEIYRAQLPQIAGQKHVAPHVDGAVALWSVLTRLKKPNSINYAPNVSTIVSNLSPIEKARLYDTGDMPAALSPEDRKLLRANIRRLREEYANIPYYEGRMGASAREIKSILYDSAQNPEYPCLSPLAVFREMEEFVKRVTEYEFLKQDVKDGYHDAHEFISVARNEYMNTVDKEVRDSIGLYDSAQWEDFLRKYVQQISLVLKKEKTKNAITGKMEDPDFALIHEFEKIVEAPDDSAGNAADKEAFRQNIISQVGAWSLDHPGQAMNYAKVFPDFWRKLEQHYFESQKKVLTQMHDAVVVYGTGEGDPNSEGAQLARKTVSNMKAKLGYCDHCAKEVITSLMKLRY